MILQKKSSHNFKSGVKMKSYRYLFLVIFLSLIFNLFSQVLPHPNKLEGLPAGLVNKYDPNITSINNKRNQQLINNILVLRIEFPDLSFNNEEVFPTYHQHNEIYFDKYMQHLRDFYLDASHGQYELQYTIAPNIYIADNSFTWYGNDEFEAERRVLLVQELIAKADHDIDFSGYEAVIVFHAGAGQETDINNTHSNALWSTFMSVNTFKYYLSPNDENYQGIPTQSGNFVNRVAFLPEWQFHSDFPIDENYHFDILGVLTNQYGRILGLPSLHDNVSSNGNSAGIGNFGIMGTGMWNNNGKIPCLPSAWTRYFAGWEDPILIKNNQEDIKITYPMSKYTSSEINKLYKVEISEKEYFLIENRQQNFIRDLIEYNGQVVEFALHSFELLPEEEQDYYPGLPYNIPIVNLMKNSLRGSEWDYFLPYYVDEAYNLYGSGLLIWHIDENIIEQNYASNTINGNALHKGVDLEEADGIQHMDSGIPHHYMRGGPFDSFRAGNNNYFGKRINPDTGFFSTPDASSYYGGVSFEIYNISESDTVMTFSVRFDPWCQATFHSENFLEPFVYDFNKDGVNEVHYIGSDGFLSIFKDNELTHYLEIESDTIAYNYTFNGKDKLVIPAQDMYFSTNAKLYVWDGNVSNNPYPYADIVWESSDLVWAGNVVYVEDEWEYQGVNIRWILPLNSVNGLVSKVYFLDDQFEVIKILSFDSQIVSNLIYKDFRLFYFSIPIDFSKPVMQRISSDLTATTNYSNNVEIWDSFNIEQIFSGEYLLDSNEIFVWGKNDNNPYNSFYLFNYDSQMIKEININFPYLLTGSPVLADVNNNGIPDLILSHPNGFEIFSLNGSLIKRVSLDVVNENNVGSGVIAWDINNNGNNYYLSTFSGNRFKVFDSDFRELKEYSRTFARPVRTKPFISSGNDNQVSFYQATDEGRVYEFGLDFIETESLKHLNWSFENVNYHRTSFWKADLDSQYPDNNDIFIHNENFVYPNPWMRRHHSELKFNIMTSKSTMVVIDIYNISGQLVARLQDTTEAYVVNNDKFKIHPGKWSSGIYFAIVKAEGKEMKFKIGIER